MGLSAEISIGGPDELRDDELGVSVLVDYTLALEAGIDAFLSTATSLCPVRSGQLVGSISASISGTNTIHVEASAPHAAYVEYGTSRMGAQPFFEPAVEACVGAMGGLAQEALDEAQEELMDICESIMQSMYQGMTEIMGQGFGANLMAGLATMAMFALLYPIMLYAYGIMDSLQPGGPSGFNGGNSEVISSVGGIDIMID